MIKHFRFLMIIYYFFQFCVVLIGQETSSILNSDLIIKDEKGTRVTLFSKPMINDVFRYTINSIVSSTEKSPETDDKKVTSTENINYYYSEQVIEISSSEIITYKIKFDSIIVITTDSSDSEEKTIYNSNMRNYVWNQPDFIHFGNFIDEEFFARVSFKGEITSIYGMEKMYENLFTALGDTLNADQKEALKNSFDQEYFKNIFQSQFQIFPEKPIYLDSSWIRTYDSEIIVFPIRNVFKYMINDIKQNNEQYIINVNAVLSTNVLKKNIKDKDINYKLENSRFTGKSNYEYNLSKGCLVNKHSDTIIELNIKISDKKDSVQSYYTIKQSLSINLLK